jgi:nitroreductase
MNEEEPMSVQETIRKRHAYRLLKKTPLEREKVIQMLESASLAPSCYNKQPWRFVVVSDPDVLESLRPAYSRGNEWVMKGSLVIAVCTSRELDCVIADREYALFDTGIATGFLILTATEMGYVAHPIAGYDPSRVRSILSIPETLQVIALVIVGEHDEVAAQNDEKENTRPPRLHLKDYAWSNRYGG